MVNLKLNGIMEWKKLLLLCTVANGTKRTVVTLVIKLSWMVQLNGKGWSELVCCNPDGSVYTLRKSSTVGDNPDDLMGLEWRTCACTCTCMCTVVVDLFLPVCLCFLSSPSFLVRFAFPSFLSIDPQVNLVHFRRGGIRMTRIKMALFFLSFFLSFCPCFLFFLFHYPRFQGRRRLCVSNVALVA